MDSFYKLSLGKKLSIRDNNLCISSSKLISSKLSRCDGFNSSFNVVASRLNSSTLFVVFVSDNSSKLLVAQMDFNIYTRPLVTV